MVSLATVEGHASARMAFETAFAGSAPAPTTSATAAAGATACASNTAAQASLLAQVRSHKVHAGPPAASAGATEHSGAGPAVPARFISSASTESAGTGAGSASTAKPRLTPFVHLMDDAGPAVAGVAAMAAGPVAHFASAMHAMRAMQDTQPPTRLPPAAEPRQSLVAAMVGATPGDTLVRHQQGLPCAQQP
jgi:hypothetical protein